MSTACTILLVEDNQSDVFLVERAFHKAKVPHLLQVVEDGEQAVAYLSGAGPYADRSRFPLPVFVLLDLKLPRKSGFEVLEWLRRQPAIRRVPVVVLTSSNHLEDVEPRLRFGSEFLSGEGGRPRRGGRAGPGHRAILGESEPAARAEVAAQEPARDFHGSRVNR